MVEWLAWLCKVDDGLGESSSVSSLSNGPSSVLRPENGYFTHIILRKLRDIQVGFNLIRFWRCFVVLFTRHFPIAAFRVAGRTPTPTAPIATTINKRHGQTWRLFSQFQRGMRDVYVELLLGVTRRRTETVFGPPVPACKDREVRIDLWYSIYGYSQTWVTDSLCFPVKIWVVSSMFSCLCMLACTHLPLSPGTAAIQMILAEHTAIQASTMGSSLMFNRQTWREQKRELVSFK